MVAMGCFESAGGSGGSRFACGSGGDFGVMTASSSGFGHLFVTRFEGDFHESSYFEFHRFFRGHGDGIQSFGILGHPRGTSAGFKHAEVAELEPVSLAKFSDHAVQECLHHCFDRVSLLIGVGRDTVDQFFFGNCCHDVVLLIARV